MASLYDETDASAVAAAPHSAHRRHARKTRTSNVGATQRLNCSAHRLEPRETHVATVGAILVAAVRSAHRLDAREPHATPHVRRIESERTQ